MGMISQAANTNMAQGSKGKLGAPATKRLDAQLLDPGKSQKSGASEM